MSDFRTEPLAPKGSGGGNPLKTGDKLLSEIRTHVVMGCWKFRQGLNGRYSSSEKEQVRQGVT